MSLDIRDVPLSQTTTAIPPLPHDACRSDAQCLNGGICTIFKPGQIKSEINDEYNYCTCQNGYGGKRCESYCPFQCQHGGICHPKSAVYGTVKVNDPNPYVCQCLGHFTGSICDIPYENCADGSQCFYGGVCSVRDDIIPVNYCVCPPLREGLSCENEILTPPLDPESVQAKNVLLIRYVSLGIVIAITLFLGIGLVMMRRRRRRNERRYHAIQVSDEFQNGIEAKEVKRKQEKWRNIV
jgi:hypothetical protein